MKESQLNFLNEIESRGFVNDCTDKEGLGALLNGKTPIPAYIGFDCTAPSLHVGSLVQIMALRWLQKCGHKPIVLMGGGTTKVGDPSGKDENRPQLADADIQENMDGIKDVFSRFIKFGKGKTDALMVNNDDWLKELNYIKFLRDYGKHFSVNRMLTRESVKLRLKKDDHLSFLEFNYMILQAFDFYRLAEDMGIRLQIGGSDQWGNIVEGIELARRMGEKELYGLTTPLITTSGGAKMGKTAQGAIWLNADMCSPYDYWQFWRNTEDADVGRFLRLFTELPLDKIEKLEKAEGAEINKSKIVLANEATKLAHGSDAAKKAEETARETFEQGGAGEALPEILTKESELKKGIPVFKLFLQAGLETSGGAVRRLIRGGGAKINDEKITDAEKIITLSDVKDGIIKLSAGKKRHAIVKIQA